MRWLVPLALFVPLALSACGGTSEPQVPTALSPGATPSPTQSLLDEYVTAMRGYVQCLRDHGVKAPDPGPRGGLGVQMYEDNSLEVMMAADEACQPLMPEMPEELRKLPPLTAEQIEYARQFARCMRANGVPSFPDPDAEGRWATKVLPSTETEANVIVLAGVLCQPLLDGRPQGAAAPYPTGLG